MSFARIALRNVPRRKLRNSLTILGIIVGVALLVGVSIASESSLVEFKEYISAVGGKVDIVIVTTSGAPFEERKIDLAVRGISGVAAVGRVTTRGIIIVEGEAKGVNINGIDQTRDFEYAGFTFEKSSYLRRNDVTIGEKLRKDFAIGVGDYLSVKTPDGGRLMLHVIGIAQSRLESSYNIYVDLRYAQQVLGYVGRVTVGLVHVQDSSNTKQVRQAIERNLGEGFRVTAVKEQTLETWEGNLAGWRQGLSSLSMVTILVSVGLVLNTMYMNLSERTYEVGVLRAMGARRRDIFWMFFAETLLFAALGVLFGIVLGIGMARALYYFTSVLFFFGEQGNPTFVVRPEFLTQGILSGLSATAVGGLIPSISAARIDIIRALKPGMRPPGRRRTALTMLVLGVPATAGGFLISNLPVQIFMADVVLIVVGLVLIVSAALRVASPIMDLALTPLRAAGKLLSKNLGRNLKRAAITYATIALAVSFIVMIGGIRVGMQQSIADTVSQYFGADIFVFSGVPLPASFSKTIIMVDPQRITSATSIGTSGAKSGKIDIGILSIDPDTFPTVFDRFEFTPDTPKDVYFRLKNNLYAIILVEPLAQTLKVSVGEQIPLSIPSGSIKLTVIGILKGFGLSWMSMGGVSMSQAGYVSQRTTSSYLLPTTGTPTANFFYVKVRDKAYIEEIRKAIDRKYGKTYDLNFLTVADLMKEVRESVDKFFAVFDLILYMAILAATAGITATMLMNVSERRREIGILRSQGLSGLQVLVLVAGEAIILGLLGYAVGATTGLIILKSTVVAMARFGLPVPYIIPWERLGFALVLSIATAVVGVLYPSYKAVRVNLIDVLRYRG